MQYLKKSLSQTFHGIKKKPGLFLSLAALQLVLIVILATLVLGFQIKILEDVESIMTAVEGANTNPELIDAGQPFLQDTALILQSYKSMIKNTFQMILWSLLIFLILNSILWTGSHSILSEKFSWRLWKTYCLQYITATLIVTIPYIILIWIFSKQITSLAISPGSINTWGTTFTVLFIIFYFLLLNSAAALTSSWKKWPKKIFVTTIKKLPKTLMVLLINLAILGSILYGLYSVLTFTELAWLVVILTIIVVSVLILTRIFWIAALNNEKNNT
ncbi:hypothetical protein HOC32_02150 [Candidatus Woesearchaeota archaeon]|nr:hypothetical protein [Candidatus Woesearchaeota archaeon]